MKTIRNEGGEVVGSTVHAFERAGLGLAPFRFVGTESMTYQACHGAPIQPGGCCDFCGTAIMTAFWIKSSDGKRFKVGCDCVAKTGDHGLMRFVDAAARKLAVAKTHARQDAKIEAARAALPTVKDKLAAMPHPYGFGGRNALDFVQWMLRNGGRKGKCEAAKVVEKAIAA